MEKVIDSISSVLFPIQFRAGLKRVQNLVIQPSNNIGLLPFALLKPFGSDQGHLIDSMSYSIMPHLCNLFIMMENGNKFLNSSSNKWGETKVRFSSVDLPLIVGNPEFKQFKYLLPQLPGADLEAKELNKKIGGNLLGWT